MAAAASLGLVVALLSAFVPLLAAVVPIMALALALGAAAAGRPSKGWHGVVVALAASVVAVVVLLPWSFDLLGPNRSWWGLGGIATLGHARVPVTELLRFGSGTDAASPLGWGLLVAASLPLLLGRGWRFTVAVQAWLVALAFWLLVFADGRDLIGVPLPPVSLLLVPAAAALALAAALGVAAAELDLRSTRFGGRRGVAALAGTGLLLAALPTVVAALDGRWSTPDTDFAATLGFAETDESQAEGDHRILWVGDPASLPVGGQRLGAGLAYGISERGTPTIAERWTMPDPGATALAAEALRLAGDGRTDRLGRLLAPFGIRYLVLPSSSAPARAGSVERPVPAGLLGTASRQLDLATIDVDAALAVYENAAWVPVVVVVPDGEASTATGAPLSDDAGGLDLSGARPILNQRGVLRYRGEVPEGTVYLAEAMAPGWELLVDGEAAPRSVALGWANAFDVADGGEATLRYRTGVLHRLGLVAQVALWSALVVAVVARRRST